MNWLTKNADWVFSGIGVYTISTVVSIIVAIVTFFIFRKQVKAAYKKVAKVFVFGSGNKVNIKQ